MSDERGEDQGRGQITEDLLGHCQDIGLHYLRVGQAMCAEAASPNSQDLIRCLSPQLHTWLTSCWFLEMGHGRRMYTIQIGKYYKLISPFFRTKY